MSNVQSILHFVGFRGEEYWSAIRVWGKPHYIHPGWDMRARRDIHPSDTVVFAHGTADDAPRIRSYTDYNEDKHVTLGIIR